MTSRLHNLVELGLLPLLVTAGAAWLMPPPRMPVGFYITMWAWLVGLVLLRNAYANLRGKP